MKFTNLNIKLRFEGLPDPDDPTKRWAPSFDDYLVADRTNPSTIDMGVDLGDGSIAASSVSFRLSATETVAERLWVQGQAIGTNAYLDQQLAGSDFFDVASPGEPIEVDDVLYIRDEAVVVEDVTAKSDSVYEVEVYERGGLGTEQDAYDEGVDVYINTPPYQRLRRVDILVDAPQLRDEWVVWSGFIRNVRSNSTQTEIEVEAVELLGTLLETEGGYPREIDASGLGVDGDSDEVLKGEIRYNGRETTQVHGRFSHGRQVWVEVEDALVIGRSISVTQQDGTDRWIRLDDASGQLGTSVEDDVNESELSTAREVLVWTNVDLDYDVDADKLPNPYEDVYRVDGVGEGGTAHPASLFLAHLLSTGGSGGNDLELDGDTYTFDVLAESWGLGYAADLVDAEAWINTIRDNPFSVARVVLDTFSFGDLVQKFLVPIGLYPVIDSRGKLSVKDLGVWDVQDSADLGVYTIHGTDVGLDRKLNHNSTTVSAKVGGNATYEKADHVRVSLDRGFRSGKAVDGDGRDLDMEVFDKASLRDRGGPLWEKLNALAQYRADRTPVLSCTMSLVEDGDIFPGLLEWIALRGGPETGFIGPDGSRVQIDSALTWVGLPVGMTVDLRALTVEVEVALRNYHLDFPPRQIAPASKIVSHDASTKEMVVEDNVADGGLVAQDGGPGWVDGDAARIIERHGRPWHKATGIVTVESVDSDTDLEVSGVGEDITSDDEVYLVLADYDDHDNDAWDGAEFYEDARLYGFLADDDIELGSDNDEADQYG